MKSRLITITLKGTNTEEETSSTLKIEQDLLKIIPKEYLKASQSSHFSHFFVFGADSEIGPLSPKDTLNKWNFHL